ncbi:MAG TPA: FAD-dependent oxidoreductase, partial [Luteolibacter sp.]|nr:FAD-dependent oxidoreductase [Luteolibacter sp.]
FWDITLEYTSWFQEKKQIEVEPVPVRKLDHISEGAFRFRATLEDSRTINARQVVIAPGCRHFQNRPPELLNKLPAGSFVHTCDLVDFAALRDHRCLIVGGRQSAFEWAALLNEAGARSVHLSYRHDTPAFSAADWSWVTPLVEQIAEDPGWFRRLPPAGKEIVTRRLWAEGRLKVEPWLEDRVMKESVTLHPKTEVASVEPHADRLDVTLSSGNRIEVDRIILATGYKAAIEQVPFVSRGNLLACLAVQNGYPVLDEHFQTNLPGLFATGFLATQDFGPFFAFTVSVRTSAKLIGQALIP